MDPYKKCPTAENDKYLLRLLVASDTDDLLKIYSDEKAVPFFNGDNCHGDDFHYTTAERMRQAVDFWLMSYENGWFVRWVIVDKTCGCVIGTIEYFKRAADDCFNDFGVLRLDLKSEYEKTAEIKSIVSAFLPLAREPFGVKKIMTKVWEYADARRAAFSELGFKYSPQKLIGNDGIEYGDYYVL